MQLKIPCLGQTAITYSRPFNLVLLYKGTVAQDFWTGINSVLRGRTPSDSMDKCQFP